MLSASLCLMIFTVVRTGAVGRSAVKAKAEISNGENLSGLPLISLKGEEVRIPQQGRYLVALLDTQCGPCNRQIGPLNQEAKNGRYSGVIVIFSEPRETVRQFLASTTPEFQSMIDAGKGPVSVHRITTFPQTFEVMNGSIVRSWVGYHESFE